MSVSIRSLHVTVSDVLDYLASEETLLRDFPNLTREGIRACLTFAADHDRRPEIVFDPIDLGLQTIDAPLEVEPGPQVLTTSVTILICVPCETSVVQPAGCQSYCRAISPVKHRTTRFSAAGAAW